MDFFSQRLTVSCVRERSNNSFKPKLLRSGNGVAEKTCHAVPCATQFGLTQALGAKGEIIVSRWILVIAIASFPVASIASTKHLECKQTTDKGVEQMIYAAIDDTADKAEVESFALSVDCAANRSCGTKVYTKDVLPSVIRLTNVMRAGGSATGHL